ncbi:MAG TPA: glycosyltransferase family 9 protein [Candidatus Hydrogenedentes bacterium]|jgi:ADP-heptose:LPS heptosyltransferase|nr:glycosyltransferase family 9 protein [Candidatus Hydrogenedentota bacterium]HPJ99589.1 glycosyltransferase family 9 protein [Candidatus Hydrogenedentota bacterium]
MRILVAQMARMGDMLQNSTLTRTLRQRYPGAHITAMVRPLARAIAERNPDINDIMLYEEDATFGDLRSSDSERLLRAYRSAAALVDDLNARQFDVIYNCTLSTASAALLKMVHGPQIIGAHLSDDWLFVLRGPWTNYFFTSVHQRVYSDINISDVFRNFMQDAPSVPGLSFAVTDDDRREVREILAEHGISDRDFVVCLQLGASDSSKRWPVAQFAELARRLADEKNARILLLGVESESPLGEAFEAQAPGLAVHLFGKTTIPQLAALLESARALVTNDTGTMHLATAVRCPVLLLSVGYVHFRETGPYGEGHLAIERRKDYLAPMSLQDTATDDRNAIPAGPVMDLFELLLTPSHDGSIPSLSDSPERALLDVYQSRFAPDGFLEWYPVICRPMVEADFLRIAYRNTWLAHLCPHIPRETLQDGIQRLVSCFAPTQMALLDSWCEHWGAVFLQLEQLARLGHEKTEQLRACLRQGRNITMAREIVGELMRLDEDTRLFAELNEACRPLISIARFQRDNLEGADPAPLAEMTQEIYQDLLERAALMQLYFGVIRDAVAATHAPG